MQMTNIVIIIKDLTFFWNKTFSDIFTAINIDTYFAILTPSLWISVQPSIVTIRPKVNIFDIFHEIQ